MTAGAQPDNEVPTVRCPVCETEVPAGNFCGLCGAHLTPRRRGRAEWLRIGVFGAAPGEPVLLPAVASSLFPRLPQRARAPFRLTLVMVLAGLVVFAVLKMPAPLIAVATLGLPLLFVVYLQESDAYRDVPLRYVVLTVALGVLLGVGWVLITGAAVARSYGVPLGTGIVGAQVLREGLGVSVAALVVMLLPAVVVRLFRPPTREALDGFMIGALGALMFTAAANLARLAPQFAIGMVAKSRPMSSIIVEAGIHGLTMPIAAAAAGGLVGTALWFTRPPEKTDRHGGFVRVTIALFAAAVLALYAGLGVVDVARLPQFMQLAMHLTAMMVAVVVLRTGLQLAVLHEQHDPITELPVLCPQCGHVVPDMAFCPACGAATRASSRSSRAERRSARPVRVDQGESQ
jgi:RsiW-degrading membrane proteinase PrsW (M82 family)